MFCLFYFLHLSTCWFIIVQTVKVLVQLLEFHLTVLGDKDEEDKVWDVILQGRAKVECYEKHIRVSFNLFSTSSERTLVTRILLYT
jgi:hypothetical protein